MLIKIYAYGQSALRLQREIVLHHQCFDVDVMGNIYTGYAQEVKKINPSGKTQFTFSNKVYGNVSYIDAKNPLRIILFYYETAQAVFLDNTLSQNASPIVFQQLNIEQPQLIAGSQNNGLWVYEQGNFNIIRFDSDLNIIAQTGNLFQLLKKTVQPVKMIEEGGYLYVLTDNTVEIFDVFATYIRSVPVNGVLDIDVMEQYLFMLHKDKITVMDLKNLEEKTLNIKNTHNYKQMSVKNNTLYLSTGEKIALFSFSE